MQILSNSVHRLRDEVVSVGSVVHGLHGGSVLVTVVLNGLAVYSLLLGLKLGLIIDRVKQDVSQKLNSTGHLFLRECESVRGYFPGGLD